MKKTLFLSVMIMLLGGGCLSAQTVSNLQVSAGTPSTVTFDVEWDKADLPALWSDTMWVFVDYNKNGKMARMELLPLSAGATLTATSSPGVGKLVEENIRGAWVVGDARTNGSFSATVQLLTATADLYGACAYASSYPPVGQYVSGSEIIFSGTPMYEIWLTSVDGLEMIESGSTFLLPCSYTVSSFTDATGAPGIINCLAPANLTLASPFAAVCAGETVTLTASATGAAQYRINDGLWQVSPTFEVSPTSTTAYTLYAKTAEGCVGSVADAAVVTVNPLPTNLTLSPSPATICNGAAATLTATANGAASYSLNGSSWQTTTTFKVTPTSTTPYTLYVKTAAGCSDTKTNAVTVAVYPAFSPGTITTASTTTLTNTNPNRTIGNSNAASGGDGNITYEWRRSGTSSKTLGGSNAITYAIGSDASNYSTAGIYYFNRYAHDGACSTAWVAATGTYTLGVGQWACTNESGFCTSSTWNIGGFIWSDRVITVTSECGTQSAGSGVERVYYSWTCAQTICPSGWSLPTLAQAQSLADDTTSPYLETIWGQCGFMSGATYYNNAIGGCWQFTSSAGKLLYFGGSINIVSNSSFQYQVRCVKD
jgi:hypothetical protein